jgi:hypothetical protein
MADAYGRLVHDGELQLDLRGHGSVFAYWKMRAAAMLRWQHTAGGSSQSNQTL